MVWNYTLNLQILAPLDRIKFGQDEFFRSLPGQLTQGAIQQTVNKLAGSVAKHI